MGLTNDYARAEAGQNIDKWQKEIVRSVNTIKAIHGFLEDLKTDFPSDVTEIQGKQNDIITLLQNTITILQG